MLSAASLALTSSI